ncbi:hypothetical protein BCAR13_440081 [Paraburkholderia caribensis]|nr:hypothetical protein BCAR13_440081 [Paraburkholderia caribensis]
MDEPTTTDHGNLRAPDLHTLRRQPLNNTPVRRVERWSLKLQHHVWIKLLKIDPTKLLGQRPRKRLATATSSSRAKRRRGAIAHAFGSGGPPGRRYLLVARRQKCVNAITFGRAVIKRLALVDTRIYYIMITSCVARVHIGRLYRRLSAARVAPSASTYRKLFKDCSRRLRTSPMTSYRITHVQTRSDSLRMRNAALKQFARRIAPRYFLLPINSKQIEVARLPISDTHRFPTCQQEKSEAGMAHRLTLPSVLQAIPFQLAWIGFVSCK